ncbi:FadR/GntR family transcriptional regulator [Micrococcus lylae]|uniref:FadR/GntR family transcriptional regulator n=1 Tax=Micrococcus lylae TaxID=1273 RepID=UPI003EC12553
MTGSPTGRTSAVVLEWLEQELRAGSIKVGDKLPGERVLAEQFGISRPSVREAVRVLDAMGLVRTAAGSGPRAGAIVISEPSAALTWALRMHVATQALPVADIVSTRLLLETGAARRARGPHGKSGEEAQQILRRACELLDRMDSPDLPAEEFHHLDAEFHVLLSTLGGNVVVETMMKSLREATVGYVQETVAGRRDWDDVRARLQQQHRQILAAYTAADTETTVAALREHILWFSSLALEDEEQDAIVE